MTLIKAIKKAKRLKSYEIARHWWKDSLIVKIDEPLRINKQGYNSTKGFWNPTLNDILANDWYVVKKANL